MSHLYTGADTCHWLVERPNNNPEPTCREDMYDIGDCGATLTLKRENNSDGWECEMGHHHWEYGSPMQRIEEADEALAEYYGMD
jgi:hypothetical protein